MKRLFALAAIPASLFALTFSLVDNGAQATARDCLPLGGMGFANAIDDSNFVATLSGGLGGGARAAVIAQQETASGLQLTMIHHFYTDAGGLLQTEDVAVLTAVPGQAGAYMLEISYDIVQAGGALAGYDGSFQSFGLIKVDEGKVVLRYRGEICR